VGPLLILFGLAFGSFLNVCISRLPQHESIVHPRSRCLKCRTPIRASDNIPLLSWAILRGRCRHCRIRISWRYPAVELATVVLFALCWLEYRAIVPAVGMTVICFLLLGLAVMDAETMRLPDAFTLPGMALGVLYCALLPAANASGRLLHAGEAALWAALAALIMLGIRSLHFLLRRTEGMGLGDAKLLAMIAAWLGPGLTLLTLFLGVVAAALFGIALIAGSRGREHSLATRLPFGSFLCAGALYAIFAGAPIVSWYLHFFR
jgi:leader peptidase (prepilin peptidase)/N-methyltransferase